jgi:uncharacterized protein YegP (UPF0339 family)
MYQPFKLKRESNTGKFYIITVAENGRTLDKTQAYKRKRSCIAKVVAVHRLTLSPLSRKEILELIEDTTLPQKPVLLNNKPINND